MNVSYLSSMSSWMKGIILNHNFKSYKITPTESANVLNITMKFYGSYKYRSLSKRRREGLRKRRFLAHFRNDPVLVPVPFLEPSQYPHCTTLGRLVPAVVANVLVKQIKCAIGMLQGLHHHLDCFAQEVK